MNKLVLIDTRNNKFYCGETYLELFLKCPDVTGDSNARVAVIMGKPDTVSFSNEFTFEELMREIAERALFVLRRDCGFILARNIEYA